MKYTNNYFFVFSTDEEFISNVIKIIKKKYTKEKGNLIEYSDDYKKVKKILEPFRDKYYYDIFFLDWESPEKDKHRFINLIEGFQTGHEWIVVTKNSLQEDEYLQYFKKQNVSFIASVHENTLLSLTGNIIEKRFNEKKYNLVNTIDDMVKLRIELSEVLQQIVDLTLWSLNLRVCLIARVDYEKEKITVEAVASNERELKKKRERIIPKYKKYEDHYKEVFDIKLDEPSAITQCVDERKPIQFPNVTAKDSPFKYKTFAEEIGLKSILITPVFEEGQVGATKRVIATLNLYTDFLHEFQSDEIELACLIAQKTAILLSMQDLYRDQLDDTRRKIELIETVATEINRNVHDHKKVFKTIVDKGRDLVQAQRGCIKLYDKENDSINRVYPEHCTINPYPEKNEKLRKKDITSHVIRTKKSVNIPDIDDCDYKDTSLNYKNCRSRISVPLLSRDEVIGVLTAEHIEPGHFNDDHLKLFEALAKHAVIAIESSTRYKQLQKRLQSQDVIKRLIEETSRLVAIKESRIRKRYERNKLDKLINEAVNSTGTVFNACSGFVALADFKGNIVIRKKHWQFGLADGDLPDLNIALMKNGKVYFQENAAPSISGKVIADGKPYNCTSVKNDEYFLEYDGNKQVKSEIVVPLKFQGQTFGVFALDSEYENAFSKEDEELLVSIATQLAVLIKRYGHLNRLMDLGKPFKNIHTLDKLYSEIVKRTADALGTRVSYFRIFDREQLVVKGKNGLEGNQDKLPLRIDEGISGQVAFTKKPIMIEDVQESPVYKYKDFAKEHNLHAMIAVPVMSQDVKGGEELIGVLSSYANRVCNFTSFDLQLMQLIAEKAGATIKNAKLFHQMDIAAKIDEGFTRKSEEQILRDINALSRRILDADQAVLYLYKSSESKNMGFVTPGITDGDFEYKDIKVLEKVTSDGILSQLLTIDKNEFWIDSFEHNPDILKLYQTRKTNRVVKFYEREKLKSAIILKLIFEGEVVGILFVNYRYKKHFSADEKEIAKAIAYKAALAISNTWKYEAVTRFHSVGIAIASESDIDKVLEKIGASARATLNASNVIVHRRKDSAEDSFHMPLTFGELYFPGKISEKFVKDSVLAKIIERREHIFEPNVNKSRLFRGDEKKEKIEQSFVEREKIKSCAALILKVRQEIVGAMFINFRKQQPFKPFQKSLIKMFANQAAITIRNAALIEQSRDNAMRTQENLESIQLSGNRIVNSFKKKNIEKEDILQPILDEALKLIDVKMGYISVIDRTTGKANICVCSPQYEQLKDKLFEHSYEKSTWIKKHKSFDIFNEHPTNKKKRKLNDYVRFSDLPQLFADYDLHFKDDARVRSALRVPIYSTDKKLLGMIVLESDKNMAFNEKDAYAVAALSNQASLALQNYRLIIQQKLLRDAGFDLLKFQDNLEKVLDVILDTTNKLVRKKHADIKLLVEGDPSKLRTERSLPCGQEGKILNVKECLCGLAVEQQKTRYERNVSNQSRFIPTEGLNTKSAVVIPLKDERHTIGVLNVESEEIEDFTKENIQVLEILASQAATAISLAQQKKKVQEKEKEANIGYVTRESVHWVGNKIGPIRNAAERLQKKVQDWQSNPTGNGNQFEECREELALIHDSAISALEIKSNLIDEGREKEDIDLIDVLKKCIKGFKKEEKYNYISFTKNIRVKKFVIRYDKQHIERLFHYNLKNAAQAIEDMKASQESFITQPFKGNIDIRAFKNSTHFVVEITDNGCGILDEDRDYLFRPFFTTRGADRGSGVGLYFCRRTMDALKGKIYVKDTTYLKGTTICLEFPIPLKKLRRR